MRASGPPQAAVPACGRPHPSLGGRPRDRQGRGATASRGQARPAGQVLLSQTDLIARGHHQADLPRLRLDAARRPERGHLDLELTDPVLRAYALAPERIEPIREVNLLDAHADDGE